MISYSCRCRVCVSKFKARTVCRCCEPSSRNYVTVFLTVFLRLLTLIILLAKLFFPHDVPNADRVLTQDEKTLGEYRWKMIPVREHATCAGQQLNCLVWRSLIVSHCFGNLSSSFRFRVHSLENSLEKAGACIIDL